MPENVSNILKTRIQDIRGIGDVKAQTLQNELGVYTLKDFIEVFPFRYVDRTKFHNISEVREDNTYVQLKGKLVSLEKVKGKNRRFRLQGLFKDESGFIELIWFQAFTWLEKFLEVDEEYIVFGKVSKFGSSKNILHPEMEKLTLAQAAPKQKTFDPIYPSTEKLDKKGLDVKGRRRIMKEILHHLKEEDLYEYLPDYMIDKLKLISRYQAMQWIHFPYNDAQKMAAENRLKFEELFQMQMRFLLNKTYLQRRLKGATFDAVGDLFLQFYNEVLPFELTGAQKKVLKQIRKDVGSGIQMNRLLQGDVGSGKTIVGFMTMLLGIDNGYQTCMMAPTEILARQHYQSLQEMSATLDIEIGFLSGSVKGKKRKELLERLGSGEIDILIGTHALIEDPVVFKNLGMAIIDEQHRFGVEQRSRLWKKNNIVAPHVLVMTATPIPRTLSMTLYGDLDVSVIDELPPGRKPVRTIHKWEKDRPRMIEFMHNEIKKGRQVYVVYPLIEESEKLDLENLQDGYERLLQYFPQPDYQISVVHGRMKPKDKDFEMQRFVEKKTHIMVATTVIEVGVNVPNASVMIIENAERFGLSQLHQLRGRVGRGADQSFCILMSGFKLSKEAKLRIKTMTETNDGFQIAEVDLKLRGPGDIEGTQQSGDVLLKLSNVIQDFAILEVARHYALLITENDPDLEKPPHEKLKKLLMQTKKGKQIWGRIS